MRTTVEQQYYTRKDFLFQNGNWSNLLFSIVETVSFFNCNHQLKIIKFGTLLVE